MVTISLCMIVKNEEAVLARCLDSIREGVDEIIVVDTGSTDKTKEIAARYTSRIYDFEWNFDFSAARNFSFSKATMDFAMWLDADDVFTKENLAAFLQLKQTIPNDVDTVMMRYNTAFDENGNPVFSYYRERMIRTNIPYEWKGRVHEAIVHAGRSMYSDVAVNHKSIKTVYSDRNLKIYEKQKAAGEPFTPRDTFYYARELYYHKQYDRAIDMLNGFLSDGRGWVENNIEACKILSYCYREKGNFSQAIAALSASFQYDMPRAEICCEIGSLWMRMQNYRTSAFWYELARVVPRNDKSGAFISEDSHGYLPCIQLCVCYDKLGNHKKAEEYNRMAGTFRPSSPAYLQNLEYFSRLSPHSPEHS